MTSLASYAAELFSRYAKREDGAILFGKQVAVTSLTTTTIVANQVLFLDRAQAAGYGDMGGRVFGSHYHTNWVRSEDGEPRARTLSAQDQIVLR